MGECIDGMWRASVGTGACLFLILWMVSGGLYISEEKGFQDRHVPFVISCLVAFVSIGLFTYRAFVDGVDHPIIYYTVTHIFSVITIIFTSVACGVASIEVDICQQNVTAASVVTTILQGNTTIIQGKVHPCQWSGRFFVIGIMVIIGQFLIYFSMKARLMRHGSRSRKGSQS